MAEKKDTQITGNIGMYYVCFELSRRGWNAMPTSRNAKGIDIVAYKDGKYIGLQIKTLSVRNPIPIGGDIDNLMGDYWVIVTRVAEKDIPDVYVMTPEEIKAKAHLGGKTYWVEPKEYDIPEFKEKWERIKIND